MSLSQRDSADDRIGLIDRPVAQQPVSGRPVADGLVAEVPDAGGAWSAALAVDYGDPYLFDHPVDHVPGMVLLGGLLDLFRFGGAGQPERPGARLAISLAYTSFCEYAPARLEIVEQPASGGERSFALQAAQDARVLCEGTAGFRPRPAEMAGAPGGRAEVGRAEVRQAEVWPPADATLVHQHNPENVLVSRIEPDGAGRTVAVRRPPAGHKLAVAPGEPVRAELFIDAARQFTTMLGHTEYGLAQDRRNILLRTEADLPCGLSLACGVYLRTVPEPQPPGRINLTSEVLVGAPDAAPCGTITIDIFSASATAYPRLRARGGAA